MTGTSCDGLDASCLEFDSEGWKSLWSSSAPYPAPLRKRVLSIQEPKSRHSLSEVQALHRDLGDWYAKVLVRLLKNRPADVIANHGQTIGHFPAEHGSSGVTLQSGDPTRIVAATGLTCVSHFRDGDMAVGGQGAPLVPLFHQLLADKFGGAEQGLAIHNIGGISNLTYLGPGDQVIAFDTGPGNAWIDAAISLATRGKQKIDKGGKTARGAEPDPKAIEACLNHRFFSKKPPKSTGRDDFPFQLLLSKTRKRDSSLVASATWITIESIARAYERFILAQELPLERIVVCGGGAKNSYVLKGLQMRLPEIKVESMKDAGWDPQAVESQAFAYFGFLSLLGMPIGGPWTGAKKFGPPGQITPGRNWTELLDKLTKLR